MWEFFKHKIARLGCFVVIAVIAAIATVFTKWVLGKFDFDEVTHNAIGEKIGNGIAGGLLGGLLLLGLVRLIYEHRRKSKSKEPASFVRASVPPPFDPEAWKRTAAIPPSPPPPSPFGKKRIVLGCLIACALVLQLMIMLVGGIWYLASQYEKAPRSPGEVEMNRAEDFIGRFHQTEADGNNKEAVELAGDFARELRTAKQVLFPHVTEGFADTTRGRFLTYCFVRSDSVVFLVQVPGLRKFSDDQKLTLEETAWKIAARILREKDRPADRLALGIKGNLDYSAVLIESAASEFPAEGSIHRNAFSHRILWPYFIPDPLHGHEKEKAR